MKRKTSRARTRTRTRKDSLLPEGWTLPALVDRRHKPRPSRETPAQRARGMAQRRKSS